MSLEAACGWTLCRSLLVAFLAVPAAWRLRAQLDSMTVRARTVLWSLLLIPFFTPTLLTGYAYSKWSLALIRYPAWNEALYSFLLALRLVPIGALILTLTPQAPVSTAALYCARLTATRFDRRLKRWRSLLPFIVRGPLRDTLPVFAVTFLLAFQEFETASLMGTSSWTVWLFDAQAGGMVLSSTLRAAFWPGLCEFVLLGTFLTYALYSQLLPSSRKRPPPPPSRIRRSMAWLFACLACLAVTGVPAYLLGRDAAKGFFDLFATPQLAQEIAVAAGFGLVAGVSASVLANGIRLLAQTSGRRRRLALFVGVLVSLPGLMGSLVASLCTLWLFQLPAMSIAYDTAVPAAVALTLYLLPRAVVLQLLFATIVPQQGVHLGRLLETSPDHAQRDSGAELVWRLGRRPLFMSAGIVCIWGYLELTPVAILAPPGLTSAPVRLYNLMHYGRSFTVAAMALLAALVPPVMLVLASFARRWLSRFHR